MNPIEPIKDNEDSTEFEDAELNHYLDPEEAELINDEQYMDMIAAAFETEINELDLEDTIDTDDENSILMEFGYGKDEE